MKVSKEISLWIKKRLREGKPKKQIFEELVKQFVSGKDTEYSVPSISWIVKKTGYLPKDAESYIAKYYSGHESKSIDLTKTTNQSQRILENLNQEKESVLLDNNIYLYRIDNFFNCELCNQLTKFSSSHCNSLAYEQKENCFRKNEYTTSLSHSLPNNIVNQLEDILKDRFNLSQSEIESPKIECFEKGGKESKPYVDPFLHEHIESNPNITRKMGHRTWSMIVFLNDVSDGGKISFPKINIDIQPKKGSMVIWNSLLLSGGVNQASMHINLPTKSEDKYIINFWLREGRNPDSLANKGKK